MAKTRRAILAAFLVAPFARIFAEQKERKQRFVIEFPMDIRANTPIWVEATSRVDAVVSLGETVWTESEWEQMQDDLRKFKESRR